MAVSKTARMPLLLKILHTPLADMPRMKYGTTHIKIAAGGNESGKDNFFLNPDTVDLNYVCIDLR